MSVQQIAVPAGVIPQPPAGAVVTEHSRNQPAPAPAPAPQPTFDLNPAAPNREPAPQPAAPAPANAQPDPTIAALLAALTGGQPAPTAQVPAQPAAPVAQPAPGLDGALRGVLTGSGVDVNRAIQNALEYGDVNLIDQAYINEAAGANAQHALAVARSIVENKIATDARHETMAYNLVGGEQNFASMAQAFNAAAPAEIKAAVKFLTDSGDDARITAGVQLMMQYAKGATMQPAGLVQAGAGATLPGGLDKDSFQAALRELKPGPQFEAQRQELFARRAYGKSQGL